MTRLSIRLQIPWASLAAEPDVVIATYLAVLAEDQEQE